MFDSSSTTRTRSASLTIASLRRRPGCEGHLRGVLGLVVPPRDGDLVTRLVLADGGGEIGRPARVAGVDRGIGLDEARQTLAARLNGAVDRGHDALGDRRAALEGERVADGDDVVADSERRRRAELDRLETGRVPDLQQRDV